MAPPRSVKKETKANETHSPEKTDFQLTDKVFAPLQDFPFWPAKITKLFTDSKTKSLKSKCEVYFYGRRETGECSVADLRDYKTYKNDLPNQSPTSKVAGKLLKLALVEIENDQGIVDTAPNKGKRKRKHAVPFPVRNEDTVFEDNGHESPNSQLAEDSQAELDQTSDPGDNISSEEDVPLSKLTTAKSTAKRKKKDNDEMLDVLEETLHPKDTQAREHSPAHPRDSSPLGTQADAGAVASQLDESETAAAVSAQETLPAHLIPSNIPDVQARIDAFGNLKKLIDKGGAIPVPYVTPDLNAIPTSLVYATNPDRELPPLVCEHLRIEYKMMALRRMAMERLTEGRMNLKRALAHIEAFMYLDITKEMLLRNPEMIDFIRRLQKFCVDPDRPICCEVDDVADQILSAHIRTGAERVLEKCASLFIIPPGKSFYEIYCAEYQAENEVCGA